MYVYASKILPLLAMPLSISLLACVLGLWLLRRRPRVAVALLAGSVTVLWVASMPLVAGEAYRRLEARFPPEPLERIPVSRCIVVLGGAVGLPVPPRQDIELAEAIDRVYKTAQLYRAGKANRVFVTAGNQPWSMPGPSEASLIGELLVEWGVPVDAIQLEGRSRNTRENALNAKPLLEAAGCDRSLLVTSAAHMHRALAAFRAVGLRAYPVSTDVRVVTGAHLSIMHFLPSADALAMTSGAVREWLGRQVYEWRGWN